MIEILEQYVMNKEIANLENAGVANLEMRDKPLPPSKDSDEEDEDDDHKYSFI